MAAVVRGEGIAHCRTTRRKPTGEVVLSFHRGLLAPTPALDPHPAAGY